MTPGPPATAGSAHSNAGLGLRGPSLRLWSWSQWPPGGRWPRACAHWTELLGGDLSAVTRFWDARIFHPEPLTGAHSEHFTAQALVTLPLWWRASCAAGRTKTTAGEA